MKQCYWLRPFLFITQRLKFSQAGTFLQNANKEENKKKNIFREL